MSIYSQKLLGWEVVGMPPESKHTTYAPNAAKRDIFELKQAADECARHLLERGWWAVVVRPVFEE